MSTPSQPSGMAPPSGTAPSHRRPRSSADRWWSRLLWSLALVFPVGALTLPYVWPARSALPVVSRKLVAPCVLITVAGLPAERVHHLGAERETTPALDRLAETGVSFVRAYAASNHETAGTASVLTGECPSIHGIREPDDSLAADVPTIAERFRRAGWRTLAFVANPELLQAGFARGFDVFEERPGVQATELLAEVAARLEAESNPRWFVWVDLVDLKAPYGGPDLDPTSFDPSVPADLGTTLADYELDITAMAHRSWGQREARWLSARYDAALHRMDAAIGTFLGALEARNLLEMTWVAVLGTCGTRVDERAGWLGAHAVDLYEHSIRVPILIRWPSQYIRGLKLIHTVRSVDVAPTLLDMCTRDPWAEVQGRSLHRAMLLQHQVVKATVTEGITRPLGGGPPTRARAIRSDVNKLIINDDGSGLEFFALNKDPDELAPRSLAPLQIQLMLDQAAEWWCADA